MTSERAIILQYTQRCLMGGGINQDWFDLLDSKKVTAKVAELQTQQLEDKKTEYVTLDTELKAAGVDTSKLGAK